jgi:hypothetical protein
VPNVKQLRVLSARDWMQQRCARTVCHHAVDASPSQAEQQRVEREQRAKADAEAAERDRAAREAARRKAEADAAERERLVSVAVVT